MPKKQSYKIIIPTARNILDFVTDALVTKFRDGTTPDISMPNLVQKAKLVVQRNGLLFLRSEKSNDSE